MSTQKNNTENNKNLETENQANSNNKQSSDIADTLAMILIDKLITSAVITSKVNQTYKTLNDHCFSYLTNFINPYLETSFIFYENGIEDSDSQKNKIYFSHKPLEKMNTWDLIPEPNTIEIDRFANSKTKVTALKRNNENKVDRVKESSFVFDADEDTKYIKSNENDLNESIDIQNIKNKEGKKSQEKSKKDNVNINKENKENKDIQKFE